MGVRTALPIALGLLVAGCGGADEPGKGPERPPPQGSLAALLARPGADVAWTPGTSDYAPGRTRVAFLVIRADGRTVERPRARVWLARDLGARPFARAEARLEAVGVPGAPSDPFEVTKVYVVHLTFPAAGKYFLVAEPAGATRPVQAVGDLVVREKTKAPAVGSRAIPSRTPTIRSTNGDFARLTTRTPPDRELLRHSVAESISARKPFVVAFATPKFCRSRTCGPVVDVLEAVRRRFVRSDIRFIHVEIYEDNNPSAGVNRWVKEWRLPTEPFVFLVGRDGLIKERFEGSVSVRELSAAVRRTLG